jgi:hypothetical protein
LGTAVQIYLFAEDGKSRANLCVLSAVQHE